MAVAKKESTNGRGAPWNGSKARCKYSAILSVVEGNGERDSSFWAKGNPQWCLTGVTLSSGSDQSECMAQFKSLSAAFAFLGLVSLLLLIYLMTYDGGL